MCGGSIAGSCGWVGGSMIQIAGSRAAGGMVPMCTAYEPANIDKQMVIIELISVSCGWHELSTDMCAGMCLACSSKAR